MSAPRNDTIRRVHTAVIRNEAVLMVRHVHDGRDYWTLPGGGVEAGESPVQAATREVMEETGIAVATISELFIEGDEACFVACCDADATAIVGADPELVGATQMIVDVAWFHLADKSHDLQVSKVLRSLNPSSSQ